MARQLRKRPIELGPLPARESVAFVQGFTHSARRKLPHAVGSFGKTPTLDRVRVTSEQVEQEHRLEDVPHHECSVLPVPRQGQLDRRPERVERPHREDLDDLQILVFGWELPKGISQVHRTFDNKQVNPEPLVTFDDGSCPRAQRLLLGMEALQVLRKSSVDSFNETLLELGYGPDTHYLLGRTQGGFPLRIGSRSAVEALLAELKKDWQRYRRAIAGAKRLRDAM